MSASGRKTAIFVTYSVVFILNFVSIGSTNAQWRPRWRHNQQLQSAFNRQNAASMHVRAHSAFVDNHDYIGAQGYSNAMQSAYDQAYSNNPLVRARAINTLRRISRPQNLNYAEGGRHIQQTAANAYQDALNNHLRLQHQRRMQVQARTQQLANQVGRVVRTYVNNNQATFPRSSHSTSGRSATPSPKYVSRGGRKQVGLIPVQ